MAPCCLLAARQCGLWHPSVPLVSRYHSATRHPPATLHLEAWRFRRPDMVPPTGSTVYGAAGGRHGAGGRTDWLPGGTVPSDGLARYCPAEWCRAVVRQMWCLPRQARFQCSSLASSLPWSRTGRMSPACWLAARCCLWAARCAVPGDRPVRNRGAWQRPPGLAGTPKGVPSMPPGNCQAARQGESTLPFLGARSAAANGRRTGGWRA